MSLTRTETALYEEIWEAEKYQRTSPGLELVPLITELCGDGSLLDAGCGSGKTAVALAAAGFDVSLCDLTDAGLVPEARHLRFHRACLWQDLERLGPYEWVVCCDVLEHLPPEFTMLAVAQMLRIAVRGLFLQIAFFQDLTHSLLVGKLLHQTVRDYAWWRTRLAELSTIIDARDLQQRGTFLLKGIR